MLAEEPVKGKKHVQQILCTVDSWPEKNIFKGIIKENLAEEDEEKIPVSGFLGKEDGFSFIRIPRTCYKFALTFQFLKEDALLIIRKPSTCYKFAPTFQFKNGISSGRDLFIAIGHDVGVPLSEFVIKMKDIYQFYDRKTYLRARENFRDLFRAICIVLYTWHKKKEYVGGDLRRSIFVKQDSQGQNNSYSISVVGRTEFPTSEEGIWEDLKNLKEVILWAMKTKPVRGKTADLVDFDMFMKLFPATKPEPFAFEKLFDLSYFICHAPLFWGEIQRYSFCSSYYRLRKSDLDAFDSFVKLQYDQMTDDWKDRVKNPALLMVLNFKNKNPKRVIDANEEDEDKKEKTPYTKREGLIDFHRCALTHCEKDMRKRIEGPSTAEVQEQKLQVLSKSNVEFNLLKLFPYALPIAYLDLYNSMNHMMELAEFLRGGPPGLNYSELLKRS